jgi:hypothetical protein
LWKNSSRRLQTSSSSSSSRSCSSIEIRAMRQLQQRRAAWAAAAAGAAAAAQNLCEGKVCISTIHGYTCITPHCLSNAKAYVLPWPSRLQSALYHTQRHPALCALHCSVKH